MPAASAGQSTYHCILFSNREQPFSTLLANRPDNYLNRDYLRENGVPFEVQHHPRAIIAQEVAATEHVPGKMLAKVVMVDGEMVMLSLPASYQVDLEKVGKVLGAEETRLAEEEEFEGTFPDCEVGAMPPFGNLYELPVYVEEALAEDETIFFRAGTHTDTMSVRYADFEQLVEPTVAEFAHRD